MTGVARAVVGYTSATEGDHVAMQIGEMLVRARAVSPADVEEAVSWQVLYGGRLGTNLLELGLVEERVLAESLGKQLACEWTCGDITVPASMVAAIPAAVARRQEIVPWKLEGKKLKVLCSSPHENLAIFDELGFRLGKLVRPVVAPEFRIHQCLRRYFDSVRQMRALDFGMKPKGKRAQEAEKKAEQQALEKAADLMDDDAFAAIYAEVMEGRQKNQPAPNAISTPPIPTPAAVARITPVSVPVVQVPKGWNAPPPPPVSRPPAPTPIHVSSVPPPLARAPTIPPSALPRVAPPPPAPVADERVMTIDEMVDEDLPLLEAELVDDDVATGPHEIAESTPLTQDDWHAAFSDVAKKVEAEAPPAPPPEDLSPLDFKGAVVEIGKAEGREMVARAVLRYARSKAARAVLLNVQGDVALGWDAVGEDLTPEVARRIAFPLTAPSAFRLVRESRSHYIGPLGKDAGNVRFLKLAGKKWPASAVLLPVLFRGRVVYILYVDNGHKQQVNPDVGELLILSQNISRSMEQLVARRQAAAK